MSETYSTRGAPFPGMDPYLERPDIWPDFHDALAAALRADLNALLPSPYYARLQKRPELGIFLEATRTRRIVPDMSVIRYPEIRSPRMPIAEAAVVPPNPLRVIPTPGIDFRVHTEPLEHRFVEIVDAQRGHKVVTLIEIVSPSNKCLGPDRRA